MPRPAVLVNSVTYAVKAQKLLQQYGISSKIIRNVAHQATSGCGYGLAISSDPMMAQNILMRNGIKVLDIVEIEV